MHAGADGIIAQREKIREVLRKCLSERTQVRCGAEPGAIGVKFEFGLQRQEPGPSVWAFEGARGGSRDVRALGADIRRRDAFVEQLCDFGSASQVWIASEEAREQPVTMHARVPVETSEENRVQSAWSK